MNDNRVKSINGIRSRASLLTILEDLQKDGRISFCSSNYRCGYSGCSMEQFFAPFYLQFLSGDAWIVFSTNSIRTDRMCIQRWNAEHIKRINTDVKKAYVVVPDDVQENLKERNEVEKYNSKIKTGEYYSAIDAVYQQSQFEQMVQKVIG